MAQARVSVPLSTQERQALATLAERECREPREHLRFMLRREARALGLLPDESQTGQEKVTRGDRERDQKAA